MNYLIINHYATTPNYIGGTRHYDLAKELIKNGHQVTIMASSFNHTTKKETKTYDGNFFKNEKIEGINFIWIKTVPYKKNIKRLMNILSFFINAKKVMKHDLLKDSPDIVIGSTVHFLAAHAGLLFAKKYNAKFLFEERDFWPQTFIDFGIISKNNIISKVLFKYEKFFYKNADQVIVLFSNAKEYLLSKGVNEHKVIYLPNGYSTKNENQLLYNKQMDKLLESNTVMYIGSQGVANELNPVLDLAKICSEMPLNFILIGDGLEKSNLMKRCELENISNVFFFDSIKKNQVHTTLKKATFSIISIKDSPLYKYGFSMNKINDYLYAGNPIFMIASPTLAKEYDVDGITVSLNLSHHRDMLSNYLTDKDIYFEHKERLKIFAKKYDWDYLGQKFIKEVKEIE